MSITGMQTRAGIAIVGKAGGGICDSPLLADASYTDSLSNFLYDVAQLTIPTDNLDPEYGQPGGEANPFVISITACGGRTTVTCIQITAIRRTQRGTLMNWDSATADSSASGPNLATSEIVFTRILVATDFSKQATDALRLAISISQLFGSKLSLVHASSPVPYVGAEGPVSTEILEASLDVDKREMDQWIAAEPQLKQVEPHVVVAYANARDLINQVAQEDKADLIIVGSHGASGLERLVLGSVAEAVLHRQSCPVLIVGPNCEFKSHPFRSILFATDLKTTGLRGAQYAASLAERFHAKLTFLHVQSKQPGTPAVETERTQDHTKQELMRLIPTDAERYCKVKARLEYGKAAEVITTVGQSESASLIVVGLRDRAFANHAPASTLSYLIRESKCPVLGVRGHLV